MNNLVFISQPMKGKTDEEILATRRKAMEDIKRRWQGLGGEPSFVQSYKPPLHGELSPLYMLGGSLRLMSCASVVYFCKGWEFARGCRIEHAAASEYGLKIIYEEQE